MHRNQRDPDNPILETHDQLGIEKPRSRISISGVLAGDPGASTNEGLSTEHANTKPVETQQKKNETSIIIGGPPPPSTVSEEGLPGPGQPPVSLDGLHEAIVRICHSRMTTADPLIAHLVIPRHCAPYGAQDRFNIVGLCLVVG